MIRKSLTLTIGVLALAACASAQNLWHLDQKALNYQEGYNPVIPWLTSFTSYTVNPAELKAALPPKPKGGGTGTMRILELPMPDGTTQQFKIYNTPIMTEKLQKEIPVETYSGNGLDDPYAYARLDLGPNGFHGFIISQQGYVFIEPVKQGEQTRVFSYFRRDNTQPIGMKCSTIGVVPPTGPAPRTSTLKTYRLAMMATSEYTAVFGSVTNAQNAVVTSINRVVGVYKIDFSINMTLVWNQCYTGTDPYHNDDGPTMLTENQVNTDAVVGNANYDIGHVFSTGGGGVAWLQCVGVTGSKAKGVTGSGTPFGDGYDIDYVAHEMGHQYGGDHTFNGTSLFCQGNRAASSAYEPGSGSTIMGYAGICAAEDLQPHSDAYFHTRSFDQIMAWKNNAGSGGTATTISNNPPSVNAGADFTIPLNTPYKLTASGSDPDGNPLTYCWEQFNLGTAGPGINTATSPLVRSKNPLTSPTRFIPAINTVINNTSDQWERLPDQARSMTFRCTARDNQASGGGSSYDTMVITATGSAFSVTSPNTAVSWTGNTTQTVTWNVGGGSVAANVNILIALNSGNDYANGTAIMVLANTPNDGSQTITVPNINTTNARVIVEAAGNIFYDMSNANITITPGAAAGTGTVTLQGWLNTLSGLSINFEIRNNTTQAVLQTVNATLDSAGNYTFTPTVGPGTYTITAKGSHWLRKMVQNVTITASGFSGVNFSLVNGDVNGDNTVSLADFSILRTNFGTSHAASDLNGDGTVSLADFSILRTNFGQSGD